MKLVTMSDRKLRSRHSMMTRLRNSSSSSSSILTEGGERKKARNELESSDSDSDCTLQSASKPKSSRKLRGKKSKVREMVKRKEPQGKTRVQPTRGRKEMKKASPKVQLENPASQGGPPSVLALDEPSVQSNAGGEEEKGKEEDEQAGIKSRNRE